MLLSVPTPVRRAIDILIVSTDAGTTDAYLNLLRSGGWRVCSASTVTPGAGPCPSPRLILLCGWDTVQAYIACSAHRPITPDTMVVAYCPPDADLAVHALDHGIDAVITQPCSAPVLLRRLRSALRWTLL